MMKNKGFTLIELLAVIVILAIIALITAPIIVGLIDDARKEAFRDSAYGIIKAGEIMCSKDMLNKSNQIVSFTYDKGKESSNITGKELKYNGNKPKSGDVVINTKCGVEIAIHNGKWCAKKGYDESAVILTETSEEDCTLGDLTGDNPVYTDEQIDNLVSQGWIPVANGNELTQISQEGISLTFGTGTKWEDTYVAGFSKRYIQVQKINLSSYNSWNPIGLNEDTYFSGIYNGGYYTISNLTINDTEYNEIGLFWAISGTVENLKLSDVDIYGEDYAGALAGYLEKSGLYKDAIIRNIEAVDLNVSSGSDTAGGLIGYTYLSIIDNVKIKGNVFGDNAGGIVGYNDESIIANAIFEGEVTGDWSVGGIAGWNMESSIFDSKFIGKINPSSTSPTGAFGGIAGYNDASTIENSHVIGTVTGGNDGVGGIAGYHENNGSGSNEIIGVINKCSVIGNVINIATDSWEWNPTGGIAGNSYGAIISNTYIIGNVEGYHVVGGIAGDGGLSQIYNTFIVGDVYSNATSGEFNDGGIVGSSNINYDGTKRKIENSFMVGKIVSASPTPRGVEGVTALSYLDGQLVKYTTTISSEGFTNVNKYNNITSLQADSNAFNNWDFESIWELNSSKSDYPILRETSSSNEIYKDTFKDNTSGLGYLFDYSTGTILGYAGYDTNLIIPSLFEKDGTSYQVLNIGSKAFERFSLVSVEIPNTVISIGDNAFEYSNLKSVSIGNSVNTIGNNAFYQNQLTSLTIPDSMITIGDWAFYDNELTSVSLGNNLTTIGYAAFYQNIIEEVNIPNSLITIGDSAFWNNKLTNVVIPDSVVTIGNDAFRGNLINLLTIGSNVKNIGKNAFGGNKLNEINIPENVETIGMWAFKNNLLEEVVIPNKVTTIEQEAFASNKITSVTIPTTVASIGYRAFYDNNLTSIFIPTSVNTIGTDAFRNNGPSKNSSNLTFSGSGTYTLNGTTWKKS